MDDGDTGAATGARLEVGSLDHGQLAVLAREHLLAGHVIDRAGMPLVMGDGVGVIRDIAIEEWMGASPVYTKRMQRLLGFEGTTVEVAMKGMQLDVGAPPEFMDFRFTVHDDHHGEFHLDHCGALMDVEPLGDEFVVAMCHDIEDPTFDATGWATNPRLRMRPVHRPPRVPGDRQPHCAWTMTIDEGTEETPTPVRAEEIGRSLAAQLPLARVDGPTDDGYPDYTRPLDPGLRMADFASGTLRAIIDEVGLQSHLLVISFARAVAGRFTAEETLDIVGRQFAGVAGVAAGRLVDAFDLGTGPVDLAGVFSLHPAFHPRAYVDWHVERDGDVVRLHLGDCPARRERGFTSWITAMDAGDVRALQAIATAVDPYWTVAPDGPGRWVVARGDTPTEESDEVMITRFSTATTFRFAR